MSNMEKIEELKAELEKELASEEPNQYLISRLKGKIIAIGMTLTTRDYINRRL